MIGQTAQTTLSVARSWHDDKEHRAKLADAINQVLKGKINCTGEVTLTASTALTTLTDARIGANSFIGFMPQTSNAATFLSSLYVSSRGKGTADLTHTSTAVSDRTYTYAVLG